jgi:hypothetical protein
LEPGARRDGKIQERVMAGNKNSVTILNSILNMTVKRLEAKELFQRLLVSVENQVSKDGHDLSPEQVVGIAIALEAASREEPEFSYRHPNMMVYMVRRHRLLYDLIKGMPNHRAEDFLQRVLDKADGVYIKGDSNKEYTSLLLKKGGNIDVDSDAHRNEGDAIRPE